MCRMVAFCGNNFVVEGKNVRRANFNTEATAFAKKVINFDARHWVVLLSLPKEALVSLHHIAKSSRGKTTCVVRLTAWYTKNVHSHGLRTYLCTSKVSIRVFIGSVGALSWISASGIVVNTTGFPLIRDTSSENVIPSSMISCVVSS